MNTVILCMITEYSVLSMLTEVFTLVRKQFLCNNFIHSYPMISQSGTCVAYWFDDQLVPHHAGQHTTKTPHVQGIVIFLKSQTNGHH